MRKYVDVMAPMRDGIRLACDVYLPDDDAPVPVILLRTPYLKDKIPSDDLYANYEELAQAGYGVVNQDCRGTGHSEGMLDATGASEPDDGYDTIEWIARQTWCNGQVGMHGLSYFGYVQMAAAEGNPPHLVTLCPFQNGARQPFSMSRAHTYESYHLAWVIDRALENLEKWVPNPQRREELRTLLSEYKEHFAENTAHLPAIDCEIAKLPELPQFQSYLRLIEAIEDPEVLRRMHHPIRVEEIDRPMLFLSGWFDSALDGTIDNWNAATDHNRRLADRRMVIGPWLHGGILSTDFDGYDFGSQNTGAAFGVRELERRWFDYWMKKKDTGIDRMAAVTYFTLGSNTWNTADCWPPREAQPVVMYLNGASNPKSGKIAAAAEKDAQPVAFESDPMNPLPSAFADAQGHKILPDPQALYDRDDIIVFTSDALQEDLTIAGRVVARLRVTISTPDADFFVRLSDLAEDGKAFPLTGGIMRCSFRNGSVREWMEPGQLYEVEVDLGNIANCFKRGHRILLDISGSCYPAHDRNLHTKDRIGFGTSFAKAVQTVEPGSCIVLPVMEP